MDHVVFTGSGCCFDIFMCNFSIIYLWPLVSGAADTSVTGRD